MTVRELINKLMEYDNDDYVYVGDRPEVESVKYVTDLPTGGGVVLVYDTTND